MHAGQSTATELSINSFIKSCEQKRNTDTTRKNYLLHPLGTGLLETKHLSQSRPNLFPPIVKVLNETRESKLVSRENIRNDDDMNRVVVKNEACRESFKAWCMQMDSNFCHPTLEPTCMKSSLTHQMHAQVTHLVVVAQTHAHKSCA